MPTKTRRKPDSLRESIRRALVVGKMVGSDDRKPKAVRRTFAGPLEHVSASTPHAKTRPAGHCRGLVHVK